MKRAELGIDGVMENATVVKVYPTDLVLEFDNGRGCKIFDHAQIAEAFKKGESVQVISSSEYPGASILAVGHAEKDEWYKV